MDALRLALGTLTAFPVRPPTSVDRRTAGWAMALAPLVGLALSLPLWLLTDLTEHRLSLLLLGVLWVGGLALLTRGIHLDGLADTADGLGSGLPKAEALEVMRRSDVGPMGLATTALVLLAQVGAAAQLLSLVGGAALVTIAVIVSRLVVPLACLTRPARTDGLGAAVIGSVTKVQLLVTVALAILATLVVASLGGRGDSVAEVILGVAAGVAVPGLFCLWCVRRLGGLTGDVLGACVEIGLTASLVAMCLA